MLDLDATAVQWRSKGRVMRTTTKRAHARVESDIACIVDGATEARIRNLSLGGALLYGPIGLGELDDTVSLEFQVGEAEPLTILGEVVRITELGTFAEYGIQHVAVEPENAHKLVRCIDLLMSGKGVGRRDAPRLYRRVELRCHTEEDFYATMNSISRDGLGLECEVPLTLGEKITVELLVGAMGSPLALSGVVTHVHHTEGRQLAGLHFDPVAPGQQARLDELLQSVLRGR